MRTIRTKVYFFNELTPEAQEKALELQRYINVEHDWWFQTYEDAKTIDFKIIAFDIEAKNIVCKFVNYANKTASKIILEHGKDCDSYKLADEYLKGLINEDKFLNKLSKCYLNYLEKECEYLQTDEAIKETFEANSYEFLADGKLI